MEFSYRLFQLSRFMGLSTLHGIGITMGYEIYTNAPKVLDSSPWDSVQPVESTNIITIGDLIGRIHSYRIPEPTGAGVALFLSLAIISTIFIAKNIV
jgi:hypothetical protein